MELYETCGETVNAAVWEYNAIRYIHFKQALYPAHVQEAVSSQPSPGNKAVLGLRILFITPSARPMLWL
jgi:hypothetical protein